MSDRPNALLARYLRRLPALPQSWLITAGVALVVGLLESREFELAAPHLLVLLAVVVAALLGGTRSGMLAGLVAVGFELWSWQAGLTPSPGAVYHTALSMLLALVLGAGLGALRDAIEQPPGPFATARSGGAADDSSVVLPAATQELDLVRERLVTSQDRLRDITKRWIDAQESERRKLARQLHDDIGQSLTALRINLESNKNRFATDASARQFIESAYELVDRIIASVRDLSLTLRPSLLDDFGLGAALREHVCGQLKRNGIRCKLSVSGDDTRLDETHAVAAYRIIQECVAGIQQRAETNTVGLSVDFGADSLEIEIREKGVKTRDDDAIASVRERAVLIGGTLNVTRDTRGDAMLHFSIPYPADRFRTNAT